MSEIGSFPQVGVKINNIWVATIQFTNSNFAANFANPKLSANLLKKTYELDPEISCNLTSWLRTDPFKLRNFGMKY